MASLHSQFNLHDQLHFANAAFIDTETTGLGGGAGVYAFMVGVGTYEQSLTSANYSEIPVVRQLFMRNPGEEPALLSLLASLLADKNMTVTFNGRSFDLPLLLTAISSIVDRSESGDMPPTLEEDGCHLDLLTPARRLWKTQAGKSPSINLESQILGLARSGEDVPGHLIPQLYVDYVNSNDARAMQGVFLSQPRRCVDDGGHCHGDLPHGLCQRTDCAAKSGRAGSGFHWQIYEAQSEWIAAENAYRSVLIRQRYPRSVNAFNRLGAMFKRLERWQEATELWERWSTTVPNVESTPYVELAKYYEWRNGDLEQAEMWTQWALHSLRKLPMHQRPPGQTSELEHRLMRIQRKRESGA